MRPLSMGCIRSVFINYFEQDAIELLEQTLWAHVHWGILAPWAR